MTDVPMHMFVWFYHEHILEVIVIEYGQYNWAQHTGVHHHQQQQQQQIVPIAQSFLSFTIRLYCPSLLVGPLECIQCPHRVDVCKSLMVGIDSRVHVLKYIKNIANEIVLTSPAVPRKFGPSYLDSLWNGKWPHSCCFVGNCLGHLFTTAYNFLVWFPSSFFLFAFP